tara:strand:- start:1355 stop:2101 length:747 start_codon:yes stop_codon:yes gene_type:complete
MRVAILASGGKDSTFASWWAIMQGWDVQALVTMIVENEDSMMFQYDNTVIAGLQAASMEIPWIPIHSEGIEDNEMIDLEQALKNKIDNKLIIPKVWKKDFDMPDSLKLFEGILDIDGIVVGALRSDYQKMRIEMMSERLGIKSFTPIWHLNSNEYMHSLIQNGFKFHITSISCEGLGKQWIGRLIDINNLYELEKISEEFRFNVDGEGGEFETLVTNAPHMKKEIFIEGTAKWDGIRGNWKITKCHLN